MKQRFLTVTLVLLVIVLLVAAVGYHYRGGPTENGPRYIKSSITGGDGPNTPRMEDSATPPGDSQTEAMPAGDRRAVPVSERHQCERCDGSGDCQACYPVGSGRNSDHNCYVCEGNGKCFKCNGKGWY